MKTRNKRNQTKEKTHSKKKASKETSLNSKQYQSQELQHKQQDVKNETKKEDKKPKVKKARGPRKFQKGPEQLARIERSKRQKIYLLSAERSKEEDEWLFLVQGTTGNQYHIELSTAVSCSCHDFRIQQRPCKHIYFIVTQVAQNNEILDYFNTTKRISKAAYAQLDGQLIERLRKRLEKQSQETKPQKSQEDIDLKDDPDCAICFSEMDKAAQTLEGCETCHKYFHFECINAWKRHNPTCPLCRGALKAPKKEKVDDPLGKLKEIQIDGVDSDQNEI